MYTKRLIVGFLAAALSALMAPLMPIGMATFGSSPLSGEAIWMKPAVSAENAISNAIKQGMQRRTFHNFIVASLNSHVWHSNHLECNALVLAIEVLRQPLAFLQLANGATDVIPFLQQLIGNMTTNESVDASDEDGSPRLNDESRHDE